MCIDVDDIGSRLGQDMAAATTVFGWKLQHRRSRAMVQHRSIKSPRRRLALKDLYIDNTEEECILGSFCGERS